MPEEEVPQPPDAEDDEELVRELAEFERELARQTGGAPPTREREEPAAFEDIPREVPTAEQIEERLSRAIREAESYLGPVSAKGLPELDDPIFDAAARESERDPALHDAFEQRMREMDRKARLSSERRQSHKSQEAKRKQSEGESARGLGLGLTIAYLIIGVPLLGAFLGWLGDNAAGSTHWTGVGVVIGAAIGTALAIALLGRANAGR
jgi:F0F1-type ATP synthase assembly protein I